MPTGTNKSPLTIDPATAAMLAKYKMGQIKASNEAVKATVGDEAAVGTRKFEGYTRAMAAGQLENIDYLGSQIGLDLNLSRLASSKKAKELQQLREYQPITNMNPLTGEEIDSGLTMTGKTKELTNIQGTTPYNKSANEHKSGLTMNKIAMSGISSKY
jgi:hypothetical protein